MSRTPHLTEVTVLRRDTHDVESSAHDDRPLLAILLAAVVLLLISEWRHPSPSPQPASVPDDVFSATRAWAILDSLVGDDIPHPAGSEQNRVVRERIKAQLVEWGYEPVHHTTRARDVPLVNILVRHRGTEAGAAVMLACHHDSVPQGPGAGDDGAAVAALLEVMRMLRHQPQPKNDIILLITDGEEFGLLGAQRFVEEHPWAQDVKVALNFEARGTSGPSCMFETAENNRAIISLFATHAPRPRTSSLFYEVYKYLPNDTDFTVFKQAGIEGLNFAFIGDVSNYHTPRDNLAHLDRGSVQHHGDNAWSLVRALAHTDLEQITSAEDNAVFFDVFGWFVVRWPERYSLPLTALAAAFTFLALARLLRIDPPATMYPVSLAFPVSVFAAGSACSVLMLGVGRSSLLATGSPPRPLPIYAAMVAGSLLALVSLTYLVPTKGRLAVLTGTWLGFSAIALLVAWLMPGACYFFIPPLGLGGLLTFQLARSSWRQLAATAWPITFMAMCIPVERLFYDALGFSSPLLTAVRFGLFGAAAFPQLAMSSPRLRGILVTGCTIVFVASLCYAAISG